jgi:hypothetical protein
VAPRIAPRAMPAVNNPILFQSGTVSWGTPSRFGWGTDPGGGALGSDEAGLGGLGELNIRAWLRGW